MVINTHKGLFVYPTFMLNKLKGDKNIIQKEVLIQYESITKIFINSKLPENWIIIQCRDEQKFYYVNKSINEMIRLLKLRGYVFQKINRRTAINLHHVTAKSNFSKLFLKNGVEFKISNHYKSKMKKALLEVWDD